MQNDEGEDENDSEKVDLDDIVRTPEDIQADAEANKAG